MAQKRMFDKSIIETDNFMDLPISSKALYFLLGMEADDEGFVSPNRVLRLYGGSEDDIKVLITKSFIIKFNSGVIVITDWKKNNWLDTRRIKETQYLLEKNMLVEDNNKYVLNSAKQVLSGCSVRVEENRVEESSIEEKRIDTLSNKFDLVVEAYNKYCTKLSQCLKLTDKRKKAIILFLKTYTIEEFEELCKKVNTTSFLTGNNDRKWIADFDFILRVDKATSIFENKYNLASQTKNNNMFLDLIEEV